MLETGADPVPDPDTPAPARDRLVDRARRLPVLGRLGPGATIAILLYVVLVLLGATTSSMGVFRLRADPHHPLGTQWGTSRGVRSDEWLTVTPMDLGRLASGSNRADSPLAQSPSLIYQLPNDSVVETIVFFDSNLLKLGSSLPDAMLFAAWWWLPTLLVLLAMPPWLRRLGASRNLAWLATGLAVLAPATAWWSMWPLRVLGFVLAGCWLMMVATDSYQAGRRARGLALAGAAGVLFSRLPTFYVPWSITISVPVVLATVAWCVWPAAARRAGLAVTAVAGVVSVGLIGWFAIENHAALTAALNTVYPGQRRSTGTMVNAGQRFGAPLYGIFRSGAMPKPINVSELSSALNIAAAWALVVWLGTARRGWDRRSAATGVLAVFTGLWLLWCSVPLGSFGENLPLLNRVPAKRAAQTLGFVALMLLAVVLSRAVGRVRLWVALAAGLACGLLTLYGGAAMRDLAPFLTWWRVVATCVVVAALVVLVTWYRDKRWPVAVCLVLAAWQVSTVNPLIFGFGDLRASAPAAFARQVGDQAAAQHQYWVTDDGWVDALFISNGAPLLSGHQVTGPVRSQWHKLDPSGQYEQSWNHGVSYIKFRWSTDRMPVISAPSLDQIRVSVDPCALPGLGLPVAGIVSTRPRKESCLTLVRTFRWGGTNEWAYRLRAD